jgi:DNA polymerase-3 subunit epsilon
MTKRLIVLDIEATGGNDPKKYDIIQLGAVKLNKQYEIEDRFCEIIRPIGTAVEPEAMAVHGITVEEAMKTGMDLEPCLEKFEAWVGNPRAYHLSAWGVMFDLGMLREAYIKIKREFPFSYACFDAATVVRFYTEINRLGDGKYGVGSCAKALGFEVDANKQHNALYDAELTALMLKKVFSDIRRGYEIYKLLNSVGYFVNTDGRITPVSFKQ